MAACITRNGVLVMCAMALMALLSADQAGRVAGRVVEKGCPKTEYAYPFQSTCQYPAQFGTPYHLVAPFSNAEAAMGGLTPSGEEDDEQVRFTGDKDDEGAQYVLEPVQDAEEETNITIASSRFRIQNVATGKYLAYPFVEEEIRTAVLSEVEEGFVGTQIAEFVLEVACDVPLPCSASYGARCLGYNFKVVEFGTHVYPAHSGGVTYAGVHRPGFEHPDTLPLLLRRVKSDAILTQRAASLPTLLGLAA